MPTIKLPIDSNVTSEPPGSSGHWYYPELLSSHIYLAFGAVVFALLVLYRFAAAAAAARRLPLQRSSTATPRPDAEKSRLGGQVREERRQQESPRALNPRGQPAVRHPSSEPLSDQRRSRQVVWELGSEFGSDRAIPGQRIWTAGLLPLTAPAGHLGPGGHLAVAQTMDGQGETGRDDSSESEQPASRGVSTSPSTAGNTARHHQKDPSRAGMVSGSLPHWRKGSPSSGNSHTTLPRGLDRSLDGVSDPADFWAKGRESSKRLVIEQTETAAGIASGMGDTASSTYGDDSTAAQSLRFAAQDYPTTRYFARPPPPPPMTPPAFRPAAFSFQDRHPSYAVSIPPLLDTAFIHQPNPDYTGSSTSADVASSSPKSAISSPGAKRRSYNKSVPIGIPTPQSSSLSHQDSKPASPRGAFSPASYPPTSPLLPPPPPGDELAYETYEYDYDTAEITSGEGHIDLQGEIISVTDETGQGWKRHTRVYGGGVCLACVASGGEHGGFYGDKVPPEQRR